VAAETNIETGFRIDGKLHELPTIDSLNMDEAQILYDYSGLAIQDFAPPEGVTDEEHQQTIAPLVKNPGFLRALMHIAYQRANPKMTTARVKQAIGTANIVEAMQELAPPDDREDDARPPESTTGPEPSSPTSSSGSSESSGTDSPSTSEGQVVPLGPTTTGESDTSSESHPGSSVA
jgi:hypothetical protein